ncbi:wings apart-like protein 2 isoform X3 [Miscanthus floridulus]|uniref:wings apart-like protein 2 isoform X3 n=1 Tax=Miscanthus floridulus TaxID=154761 RepID=UPI00345A03FA
MILRTYGRRSRSFSDGGGGVSSSQDAFDFDGDDDVLGSSASQPLPLPLPPSQESSSMWDFDEDPPPSPPRSQPEGRRRGRAGARRGGGWELAEAPAVAPTATLMEAEEYGEMMESVDEVTFALDGLRPAAQKRTRRASLLALLGICASAERRRVLRSQGLVQQIIEAILVLDIDDPPCAIAAGALLFVLASDVQDNNSLDSETCVHFLLKLLNPPVNVVDAKAPSIGSKLLGISKFQMLNASNKDADSSSEDILLKVEEILLSFKEIKPLDRDDKRTTRPELCSKWLALLTMEKACLSAVALEDTSDMVLKLGGNFKETLRQSGGLDNIFNVMVNCHSELEDASTTAVEGKEEAPPQSTALLLKCLKILENATFLSDNNKTHLLSMSRKLSPKCPSLPFVGVILSIIELLSALSLLQKPSTVSRKADPKNTKVCNGACSADSRGLSLLNHHSKCNNSKKKSLLLNRRHQDCSSSKSEASHVTISSSSVVSQSQRTLNSSSFSSDGASSGSLGVKHSNGASLKLNVRKDRSKTNTIRGSSGWISIKAYTSDWNSREMAKKRRLSENVHTDLSNGGDDPFAFDGIDQEPSNWDLFGPKRKSPRKRAKRSNGEVLDDCGTAVMGSPELCQPEDIYQSGATSDSKAVDESNLLEDCLLASVKVLMNLANENPSGCEQIASCGGINTMASLIIKHFPSFDFSMDSNNQMKEVSSGDLSSSQNSKSLQIKTKQLRDYELDFLVAILGLLVNLVEKDSLNRVRLANARVSVNLSQNPDSKDVQRDVIPLLCSIFLASQGTGETAEAISPDDEESLLQGEREAEMMIVEAYAALVLAFLSTESMKVRGAISSCLPDNNLKVLVPVLERFVSFHLQLNMMTRETHSAVTEVIERCRQS